MDLIFRDASEADLPAIIEVYNDEILHGTATFHTEPQTLAERAAWLENVKAENYPCFIAEVEDTAIGGKRTVAWCNLWHYKERPAYNA